MGSKRKLSEYQNIGRIMEKGLRIRSICSAFLCMGIIIALMMSLMCIVFAEEWRVAIVLFIIAVLLIVLLLWARLIYRGLSQRDLERAESELTDSICFQAGGFSAYVTKSFLLIVTGAVLRVIRLDRITAMRIKRTYLYGTSCFCLEIETEGKIYRPSFHKNHVKQDSERMIKALICEVKKRQTSL